MESMFTPKLAVDKIATFFDMCPEEEINLFSYQKRDGKIVSLSDFFKAHHFGKVCIFDENQEELARTYFLEIYDGAKWMLIQAAKEKDTLKELGNFNNWALITEGDYSSTFTQDDKLKIDTDDNTINRNTGKTGSLIGRVDASQYSETTTENVLESSKNKPLEYLDPNSREREQVINIYDTVNATNVKNNQIHKVDNLHKNQGKNRTTTSNPSQDYLQFFSVTLPNLRRRFLDKFCDMFYY